MEKLEKEERICRKLKHCNIGKIRSELPRYILSWQKTKVWNNGRVFSHRPPFDGMGGGIVLTKRGLLASHLCLHNIVSLVIRGAPLVSAHMCSPKYTTGLRDLGMLRCGPYLLLRARLSSHGELHSLHAPSLLRGLSMRIFLCLV